jgi:hypothetical protein
MISAREPTSQQLSQTLNSDAPSRLKLDSPPSHEQVPCTPAGIYRPPVISIRRQGRPGRSSPPSIRWSTTTVCNRHTGTSCLRPWLLELTHKLTSRVRHSDPDPPLESGANPKISDSPNVTAVETLRRKDRKFPYAISSRFFL